MAARDLIARAVFPWLIAGLLGACANQPTQQPSTSSQPAAIKELVRLPPIFPDEEASPLLKTSKTRQEQTVFVPAYSHIYYRTGQEYLLAITLSARNTSLTYGFNSADIGSLLRYQGQSG